MKEQLQSSKAKLKSQISEIETERHSERHSREHPQREEKALSPQFETLRAELVEQTNKLTVLEWSRERIQQEMMSLKPRLEQELK